jgi:predicted ATPase/class 3 adenylate cyclase
MSVAVGRAAGTVSLLFTDLEGSTRLWDTYGAAMGDALAQHDSLLRACVERSGGRVFKHTGDGICAVFPTGAQALQAAVDAQRSVITHDWGVVGPFRVRMALHTGSAERRDDDYFGPALNRCARLLGVAAGGQILCTQAIAGLAADSLPAEVTVEDLGECRLRDLARPEQVLQVRAPGLPAEFPRLSSSAPSLPSQLTSFIGRSKELHAVASRLQEARLVTLIGAGGCGKTRLALQAAANALDTFADRAWFVDLASVADPELVPQAVAAVLGVHEAPSKTITETVAARLRNGAALVILDNCEHLVAACAELVDELLRSCPALRVLATSRELLAVEGEAGWRVPPLGLPDAEVGTSPDVARSCDAVRLFADRASRARDDFALTDESVLIVLDICRRLDGIPLAIELAAARVRALSLGQIAAGLDDQLALLRSGPRTAVPRHQTLAASIEWSFKLLDPVQQELLTRLSVFAGGFELDAVEQICACPPVERAWIVEGLTELVDRSLVAVDMRGTTARYWLLETIRQYGAHRLDDDEARHLNDRHLDYFEAFAERVAPELEGPEQRRWTEALGVEHANFRAALEHSLEAGSVETGLRLASSLSYFWHVRGHYSEGMRWFERLLNPAVDLPPALRAGVLLCVSVLRGFGAGEFAEVIELLDQSVASAREADDPRATARSLWVLANIVEFVDPIQAGPMLLEADALAAQAGDTWSRAFALSHLGLLRWITEGTTTAMPTFDESLMVARAGGHEEALTEALGLSGWAAVLSGDYQLGRQRLEECLHRARQLEHQVWIPNALTFQAGLAWRTGFYDEAHRLGTEALGRMMAIATIGQSHLAAGNYEAARPCLEDAVARARAMLATVFLAMYLPGLAETLRVLGDLAEAVSLTNEGHRLAVDTGLPGLLAATLAIEGRLAAHDGDLTEAGRRLREALALFRQVGDLNGVIDTTDWLAYVSAQDGEFSVAAEQLGAAQALRDRMGYQRPVPYQDPCQRAQAQALATIGTDAFDAATARGATIALHDLCP